MFLWQKTISSRNLSRLIFRLSGLGDCPFIDEDTLNTYGGKSDKKESKLEQDYQTAAAFTHTYLLQ